MPANPLEPAAVTDGLLGLSGYVSSSGGPTYATDMYVLQFAAVNRHGDIAVHADHAGLSHSTSLLFINSIKLLLRGLL